MLDRSLWLRERRPRSPYLYDGVLGAVGAVIVTVALVAVPRTADYPREAELVGVVLAAGSWGVLVWRRRLPVTVFVVTSAISALMLVRDYPDAGVGVAALIALYTVAAYRSRTATVAALVAVLLVNLVTLLASESGDLALNMLAATAMTVGVSAWGDRKQVRNAYFEQLELRAAERERERLEAAERAVAAERVRIARELHDVVAHAMSVVAVQSGVGAHVIDTQPETAKRILETISDTSRSALDEMRRLLGVLRPDGPTPGDLVPAPGLRGLDDLADNMTRAGVPTTVAVEGPVEALAAGLDLAAYRIVQEALTNVVKHAGAARAAVRVRYTAESVELEILDDGRGAASEGAATGEDGGGHGLAGMRERAALYGGTLSAGPRRGGGYRVATALRREPSVSAA